MNSIRDTHLSTGHCGRSSRMFRNILTTTYKRQWWQWRLRYSACHTNAPALASLNRILARQMECEKQFKSNASGWEFSFMHLPIALRFLCNNNNVVRNSCAVCMMWPAAPYRKWVYTRQQVGCLEIDTSSVGCSFAFYVSVTEIFNFKWAQIAEHFICVPHFGCIVASPFIGILGQFCALRIIAIASVPLRFSAGRMILFGHRIIDFALHQTTLSRCGYSVDLEMASANELACRYASPQVFSMQTHVVISGIIRIQRKKYLFFSHRSKNEFVFNVVRTERWDNESRRHFVAYI